MVTSPAQVSPILMHPAQRPSGAGLCAIVARWVRRYRSRRALARFDARMLRDIGVTRSEAMHECAQPFWR